MSRRKAGPYRLSRRRKKDISECLLFALQKRIERAFRESAGKPYAAQLQEWFDKQVIRYTMIDGIVSL